MIKMSLTIDNMSSSRMLEIVDELKISGFVVDKDFTFAYTPPGPWDIDNGAKNKFVTFSFAEEKNLIWFSLKYM
jgi:hypothetical protein